MMQPCHRRAAAGEDGRAGERIEAVKLVVAFRTDNPDDRVRLSVGGGDDGRAAAAATAAERGAPGKAYGRRAARCYLQHRDVGTGAVAAARAGERDHGDRIGPVDRGRRRSEEHTSELKSPVHIVCRLLLEKKKMQISSTTGDPMDTLGKTIVITGATGNHCGATTRHLLADGSTTALWSGTTQLLTRPIWLP